jgi:4-amino-4-deoxy-L-arabinose transferase-like glycosyltransferase
MSSMRLKYETGIATLIQFVILVFLNIATGVTSAVTTCRSDSANCVSNLLVSLILFLLISVGFGCIWLLGYAAQDRRSKSLARLLMMAEAFIALGAFAFSYFNFKALQHHNGVLSLITSLTALALALWTITLAYRLSRADGGRIVTKNRNRQRRHPITPKL